MLLTRVALVFSHNLDADGAEFTFVHYIQQLLKGQEIYTDPTTYPYASVIYTPLYLYVVFFIAKITQADFIKDIHEIYMIGRVVSFFCVLGSLYIVDKFVKKYTSSIFGRVTGIFIFLNIISGHAYVLRPDGMKLLFFIAFLYNYLDFFRFSGKFSSIVYAVLFSLLAFLAKQDSAVYVLLIQIVFVLYIRSQKTVLVLMATVICYAIVSYGIKIIFSDYCFINLVQFNLQTISDVKSSYNLLVLLFHTVRMLPVFTVLIFVYFQLKKNEDIFQKAIILSGLLSGLISVFFLFRPGSYLNYTYESSFVLLIGLLPLLVKYMHRLKFLAALYFLFFFTSNLLIKNYRYYPSEERKYTVEYRQYHLMRKHYLPYLNHNESLFTPELMLSIFFADKNVIYGHEYHLDRLIYAHLGLQTKSKLMFNPSDKYDSEFVNGNIDYILALDKKTAAEVMRKAYPYYTPFRKYGAFVLYRFAK